MPHKRAPPAGRRRRGQAEIIGGLIVLTLIFMFAVPVLLNAYYGAQRSAQANREAQLNLATAYNERLAVGPVPPTELALRAGWIPGVWINNTGTTPVTLSKLYLINTYNNTIYAVIDLTTARPGLSTLIKDMLLDVDPTGGTSKAPPPSGTPITLNPGENLLIVFNQTKILPVAGFLVVRVESATGILHPLLGGGGGGGEETLLGGRPAGGGGNALSKSLWRGIFAPQSGFKLQGYDELAKSGIAYAWRPPLFVTVLDTWDDPASVSYSSSFIYDDPDYPGLYMLDIKVNDYNGRYLYVKDSNGYKYKYYIYDNCEVKVRGFIGTYDASNYGTYFSGYAFGVYIDCPNYALNINKSKPIILGSRGITRSDFDLNGIDELTFYSFLNGPAYTDRSNTDSDGDGSRVYDANAWTYMVARDLSGIDYIKVTVKVNYYWTTTFSSSTGCPDWHTRDLKIFSIVVWKYVNGNWTVYQHRDYHYTSNKPVQFQETAVFPVDRSGIYRVGLIFYDNYRDWDGYGYDCWTDFTYSLEHMIVEYGVLNPLFKESPPLYIVAIPDPSIINEVGEEDYAKAKNVSIDEAKVDALESMLSKIKEELNYAGVAGYTVIDTPEKLCELLFGPNPPKYAIIYWLQGAVPVGDVTSLAGCNINLGDLENYILDYHWVWVSPYGEPLGNATGVTTTLLNSYADIVEGPFNMSITSAGVEARREAYAFYLYNLLNFTYGLRNYTSNLIIPNATFYQVESGGWRYYGTVAAWVYEGSTPKGVLVLNLVHVDWDATGDGVLPETVVQQVVYSSLRAWSVLRSTVT